MCFRPTILVFTNFETIFIMILHVGGWWCRLCMHDNVTRWMHAGKSIFEQYNFISLLYDCRNACFSKYWEIQSVKTEYHGLTSHIFVTQVKRNSNATNNFYWKTCKTFGNVLGNNYFSELLRKLVFVLKKAQNLMDTLTLASSF